MRTYNRSAFAHSYALGPSNCQRSERRRSLTTEKNRVDATAHTRAQPPDRAACAARAGGVRARGGRRHDRPHARQRLRPTTRGRLTEAAIVSTCNRTELYCAVEQPQAAGPTRWPISSPGKAARRDELRRSDLPAAAGRRRAARVPRRQRARLDGPRRTADPRPDEAGRAAVARGRRHGAAAEPPVPAHLCGGQGSAQHTEIGAHSVSMAAAAVRVAERIFGELADSEVLFVGAGEMIELTPPTSPPGGRSRSPWPTAPSSARTSLAHRFQGKAMRLAELPEQPGPLRHRRLVHGQHAADHRPGHGRAGGQEPPPPADVHRRPGSAARRRAGSGAARGRLRLHRRRPGQDRPTGTETRQAAVAQAEAIIETRVRDFDAWIRPAPPCR
jgi:glutamyl-tRNA reductase